MRASCADLNFRAIATAISFAFRDSCRSSSRDTAASASSGRICSRMLFPGRQCPIFLAKLCQLGQGCQGAPQPVPLRQARLWLQADFNYFADPSWPSIMLDLSPMARPILCVHLKCRVIPPRVQQSRHAAQAAAFLSINQPLLRIIAKPCIFFGNESATLNAAIVSTPLCEKINISILILTWRRLDVNVFQFRQNI